MDTIKKAPTKPKDEIIALPCKQSLVWYYLKVFRLSGIPGSVRREQNGLQFPGIFKGIPTDLMPPPLSPASKSQDIHNGHSTPRIQGRKGGKFR
ncbi:hypothetical protein CEXT_151161 [Caerostris extrusa]|uniref:Uncharacterized protein n=1 Tax=Caerostris extrusa TaxID=172846 RepID=A0AAV4W5Y2_CAEEX|nr:hypothetical protein CEXT_151161 [Caerostris extrusa]